LSGWLIGAVLMETRDEFIVTLPSFTFLDEKNPCHLPQAPGPCRGLVSRFFFDSSSQECKQFYYGGCFGNANNFRTMAECQAKCMIKSLILSSESLLNSEMCSDLKSSLCCQKRFCYKKKKRNYFTLSELCFRPVDKGTCSGSENRYAYIPERKRCQVFSYSGCGGNENNFITRRHCFHKCIRKGRIILRDSL
uniref:BPTI/Kunitz inhibitor domain-containing protein n=1 Tax=Neolamprologus brichardi TaxID=32507 RepID=A0A3Q4MY48_NEOBR